jgi:hypothetical protein
MHAKMIAPTYCLPRCCCIWLGLGLWCLAPLSTMFQLFRGGSCFWQYFVNVTNTTNMGGN